MTFKPEVFVEGRWQHNSLVFATYEEAHASASALFDRWMLPTGYRAVESDKPVNAVYADGGTTMLPEDK